MIIIALLAVAFFLKSIHMTQRLRWQAQMRAQLEGLIAQGKISPRKAKEIISHPQAYGINRSQLEFDSFSRSQERSWIEREAAQKGWHRFSTLFILSVLASFVLAGVFVLVYLIWHWKQVYLVIAAGGLVGMVLIFATVILIIFIGAFVIYPLVQMLKY